MSELPPEQGPKKPELSETTHTAEVSSGKQRRIKMPVSASRQPRTRWEKIKNGAIAGGLVLAAGAVAVEYKNLHDQQVQSDKQVTLLKQQKTWGAKQYAASTSEVSLIDVMRHATIGSKEAATCAKHSFILEPGLQVFLNPNPIESKVGKKMESNLAYTIPNGQQQLGHKLLIITIGNGSNTTEIAGMQNLTVHDVAKGTGTSINKGPYVTSQDAATKYDWFNLTQALQHQKAERLPMPVGTNTQGGEEACGWTSQAQVVDHGRVAAWTITTPELSSDTLHAIEAVTN